MRAVGAGGAQAQRAPIPQSDWREQLSLKLERLKEKAADASSSHSDVLDEDFRQRESRKRRRDEETERRSARDAAFHFVTSSLRLCVSHLLQLTH